MARIRELTKTWAKSTWKEQLLETRTTANVNKKLLGVLGTLYLLDRKVTGESVTKLPRTAEGKFPKGLDISYSKAFALAYSENPKKLPILFLKILATKFDFNKYSDEKFTGLVARGLRTFPSLLRDRDFGENLESLFLAQGFSEDQFEVVVDPEEDIPQHTDVLLRLRGNKYRIWLFQFSFAGLPHDIERLLGRRGELPTGIHILCPLKANLALEEEQLTKRKSWLEKRLNSKKKRLNTYKNKKCKGALECLRSSELLLKDIRETETKLKEVSSLAEHEICSLEGWYFYSDSKVKSVFQKIIDISKDKKKPDSYLEVCKTLVGPEKYLGEIRSFEKTS
jgi:hypothetical protein